MSSALAYSEVRSLSEVLAAPLSEQQAQLQSMPDASPTKWHLAHTSWFFETFILKEFCHGYQPIDPDYQYLFNSYYNGIGEQYPRPKRGEMERPSLAEVIDYRHHIDDQVNTLLEQLQANKDSQRTSDITDVITLGLHHEQQHQELLLTDIKHALFHQPEQPSYLSSDQTDITDARSAPTDLTWHSVEEGLYEMGHAADDLSFAYDNEKPQHKTYLQAYALASRPVTNAEYLAFIEDSAYQNPQLWLSDGWAWLQENKQTNPLYWLNTNSGWQQFTLAGIQPIEANAPVCHINYYEANAYAHWAGYRLPTEAEWEVAVNLANASIPAFNPICLQPRPANGTGLQQMLGDVWEWTSSSYSPYPGFQPFAGVAGEYNGKFMCNQYVLRGGSCVTPPSHIRKTYRNFFYPHQSWQFSGLRLAKDLR